jgi:hypothetical protein
MNVPAPWHAWEGLFMGVWRGFWVPDGSAGGNESPLGRMISGREGRLRWSIGGQWEGEEGAMEEGDP